MSAVVFKGASHDTRASFCFLVMVPFGKLLSLELLCSLAPYALAAKHAVVLYHDAGSLAKEAGLR